MLLWLYRFFIIGFPGKCNHEFGHWEVTKALSSNQGDLKVFQSRQCGKCGLREFKVDER